MEIQLLNIFILVLPLILITLIIPLINTKITNTDINSICTVNYTKTKTTITTTAYNTVYIIRNTSSTSFKIMTSKPPTIRTTISITTNIITTTSDVTIIFANN